MACNIFLSSLVTCVKFDHDFLFQKCLLPSLWRCAGLMSIKKQLCTGNHAWRLSSNSTCPWCHRAEENYPERCATFIDHRWIRNESSSYITCGLERKTDNSNTSHEIVDNTYNLNWYLHGLSMKLTRTKPVPEWWFHKIFDLPYDIWSFLLSLETILSVNNVSDLVTQNHRTMVIMIDLILFISLRLQLHIFSIRTHYMYHLCILCINCIMPLTTIF